MSEEPDNDGKITSEGAPPVRPKQNKLKSLFTKKQAANTQESDGSVKTTASDDVSTSDSDQSKPNQLKAMAMNRTVWVMVIVAVVFLAAGIGISRFVISPSQAAAETDPPEGGLITVPVELDTLSNDVVTRGDAKYDDAVEVKISTPEGEASSAIITGAVPGVGKELKPGDVALEVVGRPVIVLKGELPVYRTLRSGSTGPDVEQLRASLADMGYAVGEGNIYDSSLAGAVRELFAQAGYAPPQVEAEVQAAVTSAQDNLDSATQTLAEAQQALTNAGSGPSESDQIRLDNAVNQAQRALDEARNCKGADCLSVPDAEDAVRLAEAQRTEGLQTGSTSAEQNAVNSAQNNVNSANETLAEAQAEALTPLPASEVVYLPSLPRRVDAVNVQRGESLPSTAVMSVSGANLQIECSISQSDADLLKPGMTGEIKLGSSNISATVKEIKRKSATKNTGDGGEGTDGSNGEGGGDTSSSQITAILVPDKLTNEQRDELSGTNVKVTIPVSSTEGEVLIVPVAALTAGSGGETRVEVMREGKDEPELVVVKTGLSANGYAEIVSSESDLEAGDLVVVGQ